MIIYYNKEVSIALADTPKIKVWTNTLKPGETKTFEAEVTLGGYSSNAIGKYLVLE